MARWKNAGAFLSPKGTRKYSCNPLGVTNAVLHTS